MARVALVTGGSRGIGAAISIALKNAGYKVAANYAGNDEAAAGLQGRDRHPGLSNGTVADYDACAAGIAKVEAELGPVDVLVNNAGITRDAMFHKMTPRAVERGDQHQPHRPLQHDASGVERHARPQVRPRHQHLLDQRPEGPDGPGQLFRRQGRRHRLHQGAGAGRRARRHHRQRHLPRLYRHRNGHGRAGEGARERIIPQIPVGRLGEPEEIARCVVFLASDEAGFITGSTISANGGQYLRLRAGIGAGIERTGAAARSGDSRPQRLARCRLPTCGLRTA